MHINVYYEGLKESIGKYALHSLLYLCVRFKSSNAMIEFGEIDGVYFSNQ